MSDDLSGSEIESRDPAGEDQDTEQSQTELVMEALHRQVTTETTLAGHVMANMSDETMQFAITAADNKHEREGQVYSDENARGHDTHRLRMKLQAAIGIGLIVSVIVIIVILQNKPEVITPLLAGLGSGIAGFLGGMGYSKSKQ